MFDSLHVYTSPSFQPSLNLVRGTGVVGCLISASRFHIETLASRFGYVSCPFFCCCFLNTLLKPSCWVNRKGRNSKSVSFSAVPRAGLGQNKSLLCQQRLLTLKHRHLQLPSPNHLPLPLIDKASWETSHFGSNCTPSPVCLESLNNQQEKKRWEGNIYLGSRKPLPRTYPDSLQSFSIPTLISTSSEGICSQLQKWMAYIAPSPPPLLFTGRTWKPNSDSC